ncbi:hypothetical protein CQW23_24376 [Capsicum baccatum]|uniref:Ubiquitin-like protease family profile domain-containing protein n=1 Tax=Capsicum baccatum TaxID=33114 RepID=A0A2G2VUM6_CAPBA|nr:hypothetical protein CQW23_24376 [Capsicum baccatum]
MLREVNKQKLSLSVKVFIYGGVGPLHSDVTVAGVAKAFDVRMAPDEEFEKHLRHLIGEKCTGDKNEMALLPEGITELLHHEQLSVPMIKCGKVIILTATNVAELDLQWNCLIDSLKFNGDLVVMAPFVSKCLATTLSDVEVARPLSKLCLQFPDLYVDETSDVTDETYDATDENLMQHMKIRCNRSYMLQQIKYLVLQISDLFLWFPMDYSSVAMGQLYVASDKISDNMAPKIKDIESNPSKGTSAAAQLYQSLYELALQALSHQEQKIMNTGRRNLSKKMIQKLIALLPKSWSKPSVLIVILESCFGQYLDLSEDNNARFQMKMAWTFEAIPYLRQQVNYQKEVSCLRILRWLSAKTYKNTKFLDYFNPPKKAIVHLWLVPTNRELKMPFFLTLRSAQTLSDPKVVDRIKMELIGETAITRKIISEGGANDASLMVFEKTSHYDYNHNGSINFSPDFAASSECSSCKCQDCKAKHDGVINAINALTASVKEKTSKRGVIPSKRISYPDTPLEIKAAKRRRKDTSKTSSIIKKSKITKSLSLSCTDIQCERATEEQYELKKVDATATVKEHNITVDNPSTASKDKEKVVPVSLRERKNYLFEGFNISDEAKKTNTVDQRLFRMDCRCAVKASCRQQPKVSRNEECLINIIKGFSIPAGLPWHLVDEVYIPINCGDEFHWVLAVFVLKERRIRVYDSISRRRHSDPSYEIQKLAKILPTYLDMSIFLDQKVRTDCSMIEAYRDKMTNLFDVQYVDGIAQQTIGSLDCGLFVAAYTKYLSDGLQVPNNGLDAELLRKRYASLLWKYGEAKAQKSYATDIKDPRRSKLNSVAPDEEQLVHID